MAGIEPARGGEGTLVNKGDSAHSTEALIKILTNLTDADRRMLSQIVERWGSLSDELKRAVLRVVGVGGVSNLTQHFWFCHFSLNRPASIQASLHPVRSLDNVEVDGTVLYQCLRQLQRVT